MKKLREKIYIKYKKHERYLFPLIFFAGFVFDTLTLRRIDLLFENIVLLIHISIIGLAIFVLNLRRVEQATEPKGVSGTLAVVLPYIMQFSFGALFSAFFIFYSRSAVLSSSWPFLVFLLAFLLGNELLRERYKRLVFQVGIYFIVLFSYSIFVVPVILGQMGPWVFILSGLFSLFLIRLFVLFLSFFIKEKIYSQGKTLVVSVLLIFIFFNIAYFKNIIPPIPLSVKESGVYHSVIRDDSGGYVLSYEPTFLYFFTKETKPEFHWQKGEPVYSYSSVFAPTKIDTKIYHRWSYLNEEKGGWIETNRIGYPISGGRGGGYRGYTVKSNIFPGQWRVDVITEREQIMGRIGFEIIEVSSMPELKTTHR